MNPNQFQYYQDKSYWEKTGFLDGLTSGKEEISKLFSDACEISISCNLDDSKFQIYLPCIRRIFTGLQELGERKKVSDLTRIITAQDVLDEINSKFDKMMNGLSVLDTTDIQAETCALICQNYINRVSDNIPVYERNIKIIKILD